MFSQIILYKSMLDMNQASLCLNLHNNFHEDLLVVYVSNHSFSYKIGGTMKVLSSTQETATHDEDQMFCHLRCTLDSVQLFS